MGPDALPFTTAPRVLKFKHPSETLERVSNTQIAGHDPLEFLIKEILWVTNFYSQKADAARGTTL